jgi:hypothetical protein
MRSAMSFKVKNAERRLTTVSDDPLPARPFQIAELRPEVHDHGRDGTIGGFQYANSSVPGRFPDFNQALSARNLHARLTS